MEIKIYSLSSSSNPNNIKYIGKTTLNIKRRLQGHICSAKKAKKYGISTNHNYNWINKEIDNGNSIIIEELDSMHFDDNENWDWLEIYWILQFKSWGFKLVNIRKGGEDNHYSEQSLEVILKRSLKIIGIPRSENTKKSISNSLIGKRKSTSTKNKIREKIIEKQGRPIILMSKSGDFIKWWNACSTAAKELNLDKSNINSCCRGKRKFCGGFMWKYANNDINDYRIVLLDLNGNFINEFLNSAEAERQLNININLINNVCRGILNLTYNYIFKYHNDYYIK